MTSWLSPMGLEGQLTIASGPSVDNGGATPGWAGFMVFLGWWFSRLKIDGGTLFCTALLPRRRCCSSLVGLGALLSSAQGEVPDLSWEEFRELPRDARVYFLLKRDRGRLRPFEGVLTNSPGSTPREVDVIGEPLKLSIFPGGFAKYHLSTKAYPTTQKLGRLDKLRSFFKGAIRGFDDYWLVAAPPACLLVTVVSRWSRELEGVWVGVCGGEEGPRHPLSLKDTLLVGSDINVPAIKTCLYSPGGVSPPGGRYPVAIVDGSAALTSLRWINARNILILLEQSEYDERASSEIASLTSRRDDSLAPSFDPFPATLPPGVDLVAFALPGPHR